MAWKSVAGVQQRSKPYTARIQTFTDNAVWLASPIFSSLCQFKEIRLLKGLFVGTPCTENEDCIDNARCKKYCSCRDFEVYFETNTYLCGKKFRIV